MKTIQTVTTTLLGLALGFCLMDVFFLEAKVKRLEAELDDVIQYLNQHKGDNHRRQPEIQELLWKE